MRRGRHGWRPLAHRLWSKRFEEEPNCATKEPTGPRGNGKLISGKLLGLLVERGRALVVVAVAMVVVTVATVALATAIAVVAVVTTVACWRPKS